MPERISSSVFLRHGTSLFVLFSEAGRACLAADCNLLAVTELLDELVNCLRAVGEASDGTDLLVPLGDGSGDGFSVYIETNEGGKLLSQRLLL